MLPQLRMMSTALASTSSLTGYKALVCLYFNGGNDSWNMLVPFDTRGSTYTQRHAADRIQTEPADWVCFRPERRSSQKVTDSSD